MDTSDLLILQIIASDLIIVKIPLVRENQNAGRIDL